MTGKFPKRTDFGKQIPFNCCRVRNYVFKKVEWQRFTCHLTNISNKVFQGYLITEKKLHISHCASDECTCCVLSQSLIAAWSLINIISYHLALVHPLAYIRPIYLLFHLDTMQEQKRTTKSISPIVRHSSE